MGRAKSIYQPPNDAQKPQKGHRLASMPLTARAELPTARATSSPKGWQRERIQRAARICRCIARGHAEGKRTLHKMFVCFTRTACEFEVVHCKVTVDGQSRNLGGASAEQAQETSKEVTPDGEPREPGVDDGAWPSSADIRAAFTTARNTCFPRQTEGDEWTDRKVVVVTYAVDVVGQEELPATLGSEDFNLSSFTGRAEVKQVTTGKGAQKRTFNALVVKGEWPEEDQQALLENNPEKKENAAGEETDNPAQGVVKKALTEWNSAWKKLQKKMAGADEGGEQ